MRRKTPPVEPADTPPLDLRRCPWTRWDSTDRGPARFEEWLRARQQWRQTHAEPLPSLCGRDRLALRNWTEAHRLDPAVVSAELTASKGLRPPPYESPGPVVDRPGPGSAA